MNNTLVNKVTVAIWQNSQLEASTICKIFIPRDQSSFTYQHLAEVAEVFTFLTRVKILITM